MSNFQLNLEDAPRQPKVPQRDPTGTPGRPKGPQRTANGSPRDPQREPKGAKGYLGGLEKNRSKTNLYVFLMYDETNQLYRQLKSGKSALILFVVTLLQENRVFSENMI